MYLLILRIRILFDEQRLTKTKNCTEQTQALRKFNDPDTQNKAILILFYFTLNYFIYFGFKTTPGGSQDLLLTPDSQISPAQITNHSSGTIIGVWDKLRLAACKESISSIVLHLTLYCF